MRCPSGSIGLFSSAKRMFPDPTKVFGTIVASTTLTHGFGVSEAKYADACLSSFGVIAFAIVTMMPGRPLAVALLRAPLLKSSTCCWM